MSKEQLKDLKEDDIKECARQALFFLNEQRVSRENLIYKNAAKQFVENIVRLIKDAGTSIQSSPTTKSTK